jgi:hypothetical protein
LFEAARYAGTLIASSKFRAVAGNSALLGRWTWNTEHPFRVIDRLARIDIMAKTAWWPVT